MRFAVLSAGSLAGRMVSRELAESVGTEAVSMFDSTTDLASAAARLRDNAVVRVADSSADAIEGASSAVSCAVTLEDASGHVTEAIRAAVPLVWAGRDLEIAEALLQTDAQAKSAGVTVVAGGGWSPGLTNLLALAACESLESVKSVRIAWAVSAAGAGADEAVTALVESFSRPAPVFEGGSWHRVQPGNDVEDVYFPEPLGWTSVRVCAGAEPLTLPRSVEGLESVAVKAGAAENSVVRLARMLGDASTLSPAGSQRRVLNIAGPWLKSIRRVGGSARGWSAIRVDARGRREGRPVTQTFGVLDQLMNLIAAPPSVAAMMLARGDAREHGALPAEKAFEPNKFFVALSERGIKVARLQR